MNLEALQLGKTVGKKREDSLVPDLIITLDVLRNLLYMNEDAKVMIWPSLFFFKHYTCIHKGYKWEYFIYDDTIWFILVYISDGMLSFWLASCHSQDMAMVSNGATVDALCCFFVVHICCQVSYRYVQITFTSYMYLKLACACRIENRDEKISLISAFKRDNNTVSFQNDI